MIPFQPEILTKFLDVGKNSFKIPAEPMILILNNLSKKKKEKSSSASIVIRTLAVIKTISGSSG